MTSHFTHSNSTNDPSRSDLGQHGHNQDVAAETIRERYRSLFGGDPPPGSAESLAPVGLTADVAAQFILDTETFVQVFADSAKRRDRLDASSANGYSDRDARPAAQAAVDQTRGDRDQ